MQLNDFKHRAEGGRTQKRNLTRQEYHVFIRTPWFIIIGSVLMRLQDLFVISIVFC